MKILDSLGDRAMGRLYIYILLICLNLALGAISKERFDPSWLLPFEPSTSTKSPRYNKSEFDSLKSEVVSRLFWLFHEIFLWKWFDKADLKVKNGEITGKVESFKSKVGKMESAMEILKAELVIFIFIDTYIYLSWNYHSDRMS